MNATDFVYDGINLSSYGFMIADLDSESSWSSHVTDSQKNFVTVSQLRGKYMPFASVSYDEAIKVEFSILKDPDLKDDPRISLAERREIKRWLNRDEAHKFFLLDPEYYGIMWEGSFNVEEVFFSGECYALNLTFQTNRPFAFGKDKTITASLTQSEPLVIHVLSDDDGYITPEKVEFVCKAAGTLRVTNEFDNRTIEIANCTANEIITLTSALQIASSDANHDLANDFNYVFLRLNSSFKDGDENVISLGSSSIACDITVVYKPIIKAVIV